MKTIKLLLNITIMLFMVSMMIFTVVARKIITNNEERIETLEKDVKNLRAELGKQRIIFHTDNFYSPIDIEEMKTIQNEITRRLKFKYIEIPAQKKFIKRRW